MKDKLKKKTLYKKILLKDVSLPRPGKEVNVSDARRLDMSELMDI